MLPEMVSQETKNNREIYVEDLPDVKDDLQAMVRRRIEKNSRPLRAIALARNGI